MVWRGPEGIENYGGSKGGGGKLQLLPLSPLILEKLKEKSNET